MRSKIQFIFRLLFSSHGAIAVCTHRQNIALDRGKSFNHELNAVFLEDNLIEKY